METEMPIKYTENLDLFKSRKHYDAATSQQHDFYEWK